MQARKGVFVFVDGTPVQKTYWAGGEPSIFFREDCVGINQYGPGIWYNKRCSRRHPFLFQKPNKSERS